MSVQRDVDVTPPDHDEDDGDSRSISITVSICGVDDVYRSASAVLESDATDADLAAELVTALRAVGVSHGGQLGVELARRLPP